MSETAIKNPKDKWIPWYFVWFFAVIVLLDGTFVYIAISTQTGLVTDNPYEKGLAYNKILDEARDQPEIHDKISFKDGVLRWDLNNIRTARAKVLFVRDVQDGYDFSEDMVYSGGVYQTKPNFPLKGQWTAKLSATWDNQNYHKTYPLSVQ